MIQIHPARPEDRAAAEALWTEAFGDDRAYQREFYRLCGVEGPVVLLEDGALRSMFALPQLGLVQADGRRFRAAYGYALATAPDQRGKGFGSMMIETVPGLLRQWGVDCFMCVPAGPELFPFYARCGYQTGFWIQRETFEPVPGPAQPVSPEEYNTLREKLLAGRTHVAYTIGQLTFQQAMCPQAGSGLYRLDLPHGPGCAAVENWPDGPVVKELLCHRPDVERGGGAAAALCGGPAQVRFPAAPGEGRPYGVIYRMSDPASADQPGALPGWLGLAFD